MKRRSAVWLALIMTLYSGITANAQQPVTSVIEPQKIWLTYSKTTNLIFPYAIKGVDRGSKDILVQKAIGVENVLQLKAAQRGFGETNLTVVTADGGFFSYLVNYADSPAELTIKISPPVSPQPVAVFTGHATTDVIGSHARIVNVRKRVTKGLVKRVYGIRIDMQGIYICQDVLYFQMTITNNTAISYDVQQFRFFIRDRKKSRRTASQETELQPLHIEGNARHIPGNSEQNITVAVSKFTIPNNKYLFVQFMEQNGGRHLSLKVTARRLAKAQGL